MRQKRRRYFMGMAVLSRRGQILYLHERQPIAGVTAHVDSSGHLARVFLRRKIDTRTVHLHVDGPSFHWSILVPPEHEIDAQNFALYVNDVAESANALLVRPWDQRAHI